MYWCLYVERTLWWGANVEEFFDICEDWISGEFPDRGSLSRGTEDEVAGLLVFVKGYVFS